MGPKKLFCKYFYTEERGKMKCCSTSGVLATHLKSDDLMPTTKLGIPTLYLATLNYMENECNCLDIFCNKEIYHLTNTQVE